MAKTKTSGRTSAKTNGQQKSNGQSQKTKVQVASGTASGNTQFYGMDVEFKFDAEGAEEAHLFVKQARPYRGRGTDFTAPGGS